MKHLIFSLAVVTTIAAICAAQADIIRSLEQECAQSARAGHNLVSFYVPSFYGITSTGRVIDAKSIMRPPLDSRHAFDDAMAVRIYGNGAIVTGTQKSATGPELKFLRVWVRGGNSWKIAAFQATSVATGENPASSPIRSLELKALETRDADEQAVLEIDQKMTQANERRDAAALDMMSIADHWSVGRGGKPEVPISKRPNFKSIVKVYDRVEVFGDIAVVQGTMLWMDVDGYSPGVLRFTDVWVRQNSKWLLAAEQRTPAS